MKTISKINPLLSEDKLPAQLKSKLPRDDNPLVLTKSAAIRDVLQTFKAQPLSTRQIMVAVYNKHKIIVEPKNVYGVTSVLRKRKLLKSNNSKHQLV